MGVVFAMSSMAFAQITCGLQLPIGATPNGTNTGHVEPIAAGPSGTPAGSPTQGNPPTAGGGRLRVTCQNPATTTVNTGVVALTISLGVPITNSTSHPSTATGIRLGNGANDLVTGSIGTTVRIDSINFSGGTITLGVGQPNAFTWSAATSTATPFVSSFEVQGVLVSLNGKTTPAAASLTSSGGITIGTFTTGTPPNTLTAAPTQTVIDNVIAGLADPSVPNTLPSLSFFSGVSGGPAVLNSAGGAIKGNFVLRLPEAYRDMYRESSQFNGGAVFPASPSSDTQVQIILSNIPTGLNIADCSVALTNQAGTIDTGGSPGPTINFTNVTSASPILTVNFNSPTDLDNIDILWLKCATVSVGSATLPLPSTPVTAQVTLAPTGAALSGGAVPAPLTGLTTGQIPRYQALLQPSSPVTVIVFPPTLTSLLVPFSFVGPGYNTGLAIANTTVDPFTPAGGGAAASSGTVSFLMVKNDGTTKTYTTTTGSPGSGLTGAGVVASGSTYVVNLSELLSAASFGTTFTGYVFITANFTMAHGSATIYTTSTGAQALAASMLVVESNGGNISSANPRESPESLGQ
jgi:hypothetical protein